MLQSTPCAKVQAAATALLGAKNYRWQACALQNYDKGFWGQVLATVKKKTRPSGSGVGRWINKKPGTFGHSSGIIHPEDRMCEGSWASSAKKALISMCCWEFAIMSLYVGGTYTQAQLHTLYSRMGDVFMMIEAKTRAKYSMPAKAQLTQEQFDHASIAGFCVFYWYAVVGWNQGASLQFSSAGDMDLMEPGMVVVKEYPSSVLHHVGILGSVDKATPGASKILDLAGPTIKTPKQTTLQAAFLGGDSAMRADIYSSTHVGKPIINPTIQSAADWLGASGNLHKIKLKLCQDAAAYWKKLNE